MIGGIEETSASFEARSAPRSYPTDLHRPRAVRWRPRGRRRSVGRGEHRPAIEPRKLKPGCRRCFERGRQHEQAHHRERPLDPAWSKNLACADAPCAGTGRSRDRPFGRRRRSASGRRGAVADDARSREVRLCHSSWEADEQSDPDRSGAGGAKGGGQGECEPAKHAPDSEPGKRVPRAGAHTANALPSHTRGGSRMPELGPYGSVRGALSNERPYRDLRNVVANYPFESSRGFPGSEPNSGPGDQSRLSCSAGHKQLGGWVLPGSSASVLHGRWPSCGVAEKARIGRDLFRSEDDPPAAKPATPLLSLRWTFRAKRACVVITDAEPDRLAPLTPPAPMGLRGVCVVAARCCASLRARCCADAVERSFACPSANLRAPSRRGLHPRSVRRQPAAVSPRGERIRSRRGCWHCCADRAAPPSPP